jgi:GNAT superfamily N-acetyltransferase
LLIDDLPFADSLTLMLSPESLRPPQVFRLVCRPALPKDTPNVMELTSKIWEGHDYIPSVWADWLHDPEGLMAVAEFGGRVVGLSKLTRLSPSEWWLEGLRVHPEYEGRGIASHVHAYLMEYWQHQGGGAIRLATASYRKAVHHLSLRSGLHKAAELTHYAAEAIPGQSGRFALVKAGEETEAADFALRQSLPTCPNRLMSIGWQWVALSAGWIATAVRRGQAWWWLGDQEERRGVLLAQLDDEEETADKLRIQLLACSLENLVACLEDYRRLAGSLGYQQVGWMAPLDPTLEVALLEAGFKRDWEDSLFIFEKEIILSSTGDAALGQAA